MRVNYASIFERKRIMMNDIVVDKLTLSYPDGFHIMDAGEKERLNFLGGDTGECLSDPDRHIIISIGYKSAGGLGFLVSAKDAAKKTEAAIRKAMLSFSYHLNGFDKRSIGGEDAEGFRYEYEAQGISMYAESVVVKHEHTLYYLHFYARKELLEESLAVWGDILSSAGF